MWATYKFYDEQKRRLSIFGEIKEGKIVVTVIPCSKKDEFTKKKAKDLLIDDDAFKTRIAIEGTRFADFIRFCNDNFLKMNRTYISFNKILHTKETKSWSIFEKSSDCLEIQYLEKSKL